MSVSEGLDGTFRILLADAYWILGNPNRPTGCALIFWTDMEHGYCKYATVQGGLDRRLKERRPISSTVTDTYCISNLIGRMTLKEFDILDATRHVLPESVSDWNGYVRLMQQAYVRHLERNH